MIVHSIFAHPPRATITRHRSRPRIRYSQDTAFMRHLPMARDLDTDLQTLNTVLTFAQNRDFERAAALAEKTLASGFEHPLLLNVIATRLEQEGKFEDSLRLLERAVAIAPGDVGARNALSMCLQRLDRHAEALDHVDILLKIHPGSGLCACQQRQRADFIGPARRARSRATCARWSWSPAISLQWRLWARLPRTAGSTTRRDAGRNRRLPRLPGFPDAVLSLAAAELASGATARAETLLQQLIMDPRAGPSDKARASGLLGDVLDAAGRYAEAFDAYTTCNEALRQIHRRFANGTSVLAYTRALSAAVRNTSPGQWLARAAAASHSRRSPRTCVSDWISALRYDAARGRSRRSPAGRQYRGARTSDRRRAAVHARAVESGAAVAGG